MHSTPSRNTAQTCLCSLASGSTLRYEVRTCACSTTISDSIKPPAIATANNAIAPATMPPPPPRPPLPYADAGACGGSADSFFSLILIQAEVDRTLCSHLCFFENMLLLTNFYIFTSIHLKGDTCLVRDREKERGGFLRIWVGDAFIWGSTERWMMMGL